jgi:hypothetical protein
MNQTYLKDYDKGKISQFEKNYLSSYYGQQNNNVRDLLVTYGPSLGLQNNIMMVLRRVVRYNGIDINYFAEQMFLVERLISAELLSRGSFLKFIFQFGDYWYYIQRCNRTDERSFFLEPIIKDGFWDFSSEVFGQEGTKSSTIVKLNCS